MSGNDFGNMFDPREPLAPQDARQPQAPRHSRGSQPEARVSSDEKKPKRRTGLIVGIVVTVVVIVLLLLLGLRSCSQNGGLSFDPNAQSGQAPYKTEEEIQAELDRIVEEGMFSISISGIIEFDDGTSEGIAYIENVPGNRYLMQVTITLDDTGEVIYESGIIAPDNYIATITLSRDLDPGTYDATATFTALDKETQEEQGQAAAKVSLVVNG